MNFWILGFLWGIGRNTGESFLIQSVNRELVERVRDIIAPGKKVFPVHGTNDSVGWRLKLALSHPYVQWMYEHGYEGRVGNIERDIPIFEDVEDEAEFLRGFFCVHVSIDRFENRKARHSGTRVRFYAAAPILERLNRHLHENVGTTLKTVQKHGKNDVCHILYYTSKKEVPAIIEYLGLQKHPPA
jgi:hypothetical protein